MENSLHALLVRQLKHSGIKLDDLPENLRKFISSVNTAYESSDQDRLLLKSSLELSAQELFDQSELFVKHVDDLKSSKDSLSKQAELLREKAYELAVARDEAVETSRLKSAFLANMSHEIRTPMNATLGLLRIVLGTDLKSDQREYLNLAEQSSLGLLSIIEDILDFSKIEAGKLDIESIEFKPRYAIKSILAIVYNQAAIKGIELFADIDPNLPAKLVSDPNRLKQVLINLLSNAIKFTNKGHVLLRVRWLGGGSMGEGKISFLVKDTGIGIDPTKKENIFKAFQQGEGSVTRRFGGTGLGLSISQHLVGLLGGEIQINSTLGEGSEFFFELNLPCIFGSDTLISVREDIFNKEKYTVITESKILFEVIQSYVASFSRNKVKVHFETVERINKNLAMLRGVVFYDIGLGLTPTRKLMIESLIKTHCKLIIITSMFDIAGRETLLNLGARGVLFKPFIDSDLSMVLKQALCGNTETVMKGHGTLNQIQSKQPLRIVVVDDIHVNRLVAQKLLEQRGHEVLCFEGGEPLLQHLRNGKSFSWEKSKQSIDCDLILLDVQMPGIDGIETTQLIRKWEVENDEFKSNHIPIVALTAHALKGDRERFIESGMDDALRKPLDSDALTLLLNKISEETLDSYPPMYFNKSSKEIGELLVFDQEQLLHRFNNDLGIIEEIVLAFLEEEEELNLELDRALEASDCERIRKAAHALKGSLLNVAGSISGEIACKLESAATERSGGYQELRMQLKTESRFLKAELERMLS